MTKQPATFFDKLDDAKAAALAMSVQFPKDYVTVQPTFGWMVVRSKRLNVFAPSDSANPFGQSVGYWLNGKHKTFTPKQWVADQNATPMMK